MIQLSTDAGHLNDTISNFNIPLINFTQLDSSHSILGVGGNCVVWKGMYRPSKFEPARTVAVKESKQENISVSAVKSFLREAFVSTKFEHRNILKFYGVCVAPPQFLMVYEWCNQKDLGLYLVTSAESLSPASRVDLAMQAMHGLSFFHQQGLVHRDIKPSNYLIHINQDNDVIVKLADFGSCRSHYDEMPIFRGISPIFAAPEIQEHFPEAGASFPAHLLQDTIQYGTEIDIFSFGWVIWSIFFEENWRLHLKPHYDDMVQGWTPDLEKLPPQIAGMLQQCWYVNPRCRPTIEELQQSLQTLTRIPDFSGDTFSERCFLEIEDGKIQQPSA